MTSVPALLDQGLLTVELGRPEYRAHRRVECHAHSSAARRIVQQLATTLIDVGRNVLRRAIRDRGGEPRRGARSYAAARGFKLHLNVEIGRHLVPGVVVDSHRRPRSEPVGHRTSDSASSQCALLAGSLAVDLYISSTCRFSDCLSQRHQIQFGTKEL